MANLSTDISNNLYFIDEVFKYDFKKNKSKPLFNDIDFKIDDKLCDIEYKQNNFNLRNYEDIEFGKPSDILVIGCSQTFGSGIPYEYTWSSIVKNFLNLSVTNAGICGGGAEQIINFAIYYINKIGKPKYILALMPDFFRFQYVFYKEFYKINCKVCDKDQCCKNNERTDFLVAGNCKTSDFYSGEIYLKDKIVKFPTEAEYIIPPQEPIKQFLFSLYTLQSICDLLDIKLYWSTWHSLTHKIFTSQLFTKEDFFIKKEYFIPYENSEGCNLQCASVFPHYCQYLCINDLGLSIKEKYKILWHQAADNHHIGIHDHAHIARSFIKKIQSS